MPTVRSDPISRWFAQGLENARNQPRNTIANVSRQCMMASMLVKIEEPITVAGAAEILGVSEMRVRQLCQAGLIGRKVGIQWLFTATEIHAFKPRHKRKRGPEKKSKNIA